MQLASRAVPGGSWGSGYQADLRPIMLLPNPVTRAELLEVPELGEFSDPKRPKPLGCDVGEFLALVRREAAPPQPGSGLSGALDAIGA